MKRRQEGHEGKQIREREREREIRGRYKNMYNTYSKEWKGEEEEE